jgi:hypothetical protein
MIRIGKRWYKQHRLPPRTTPRGSALHYEIPKCINSIWNKEHLSQQWKESILAHIYNKRDEKTAVFLEEYNL